MNTSIKLVIGLGLSASLMACGGETKADKSADKASQEVKKEMKVEEKTISITPNESKVMWSGSVVGVYTHEGTVDITEGSLTLAGDKITGGNFTADLTTMVATDENYTPEEGKSKEKLIGHLSADDFFKVEEFPTATFKVKSHNAEANTLTGDLTIRGITHEETVEEVSVNLEAGTASGKLTFDRKNYDVAFDHPAQDVVITDDVDLTISLKM